MLRHLARHQRLAQRRRAVAVERQQQAAAGSAIEAMDEEDLPAELLAQPVRGEVALPARQLAVVDHQASGLVNDGKELVDKTGNAPRRDRVCQYVWISGG